MAEVAPAPDYARAAAWLRVLAHPIRLALVCHLDDHGPTCAGDLAQALDIEDSALSHHLRALRRAAVVVDRRDGRHRIYRVVDHHVVHVVRDALRHLEC